jgi:universal stress protein A
MPGSMFRHILLPIDLSDRNDRLLRVAAGIARGNGARVTVLHVIQRIAHLPQAELQRFYARIRRKAEVKLARACRTLGRSAVRSRGRIVIGEPYQDILRLAATARVDLIVLGSHRIGLRPALGLGTTSYRVGILCRCPVLLVK